jgi:hypothetical protein
MRLALPMATALALAACGRPDVVAEEADTNLLPAVNTSTPSVTGARPDNAVATGPGAVAAAAIPTSLHGRLGLTPGDCMESHGDEGLLTITANEVRFYESVAVPSAKAQTSANSISAEFAFTGEGESWTRHQTFELRGNTLVRTERDPVATFRYVRC